MTKGSYTVGEDGTAQPSRKDTSYRSFICVLLIFLCICLIILLASVYLGKGKSEASEKNGDRSENLAHTGRHDTEDIDENMTKTNKTHEGIKMTDQVTTEREELTTRLKITTRTTEYIRIVTDSPKSTSSPTKEVEQDELTTRLRTTVKIATTEDVLQVTDVNQFTPSPTEETTEQSRFIETPPILQNTTQYFDNDSTTLEPKLTEGTESVDTTVSSELDDITSTINPQSVPDVFSNLSTASHYDKLQEETTTISEEPTSTEEEESPSTLSFKAPTTTVSTTTTSTTTPRTTRAVSTTPKTTTTTSTTEISIMESDSFTESDLPSPATNLTTSTTEDPVVTETILLRRMSSPLIKAMNPVCTTPVCKTVASRILSMMNHSSEPCVDFYEFACGNFYQTLDDSSEHADVKMLDEELYKVGSSSPKFLRDYQSFHRSCLEYEDQFNYRHRMKGLETLLDQVGQFQLNDSSEIDLTELVSSLLLRQSMPLFDIGLDVDKQSSNFILQLNLPHQSFLRTSVDDWSGLSLLKRHCLKQQQSRMHIFNVNLTEVYALYQNCQADYSNYLNSLETVIRDLKDFSALPPNVLRTEIKDIRFTIEFQVLNNLDTLPSSAKILSNFINKNYQMRKVSDLQLHFPIFDWKRLFQILTGHQIQDDTLVQVYFAQYFKSVFQDLLKVNKRKLNNAFLAIHAYDLFINTVIPKRKSTRNYFCADLSKKLLPDVWSHLVHKAIPVNQQEHDNREVTELFEELKKTYCRSLFESKWIDDDTQQTIQKKCNDIKVEVFVPPDGNSLINNYQFLNITQDYQSNLMLLLANFKKMVYSSEGKYLSAKEIFSYFLDPMSRKPLTFYSNPMIAVPLGLMKRSHPSLPDYLVKTRVGFSLARQLARHFDPTGMAYGVRLKSLSKSSYSEFVNTMTNLMDYSSPRMFHEKNISFFLNGSLSINERIVDNTAFRLIYDSLDLDPGEHILPWISTQYSKEKVFFIAAAQELCKKTSMSDFMLQVFEQRHLPAVLRVENIMGNSPQFASKFSCPVGSGMDFPVKLQFPDLEIVQEEEEYQEEDDNLEQNK